ncbi:MAG: hypothetical protein EXS43_13435 [Opitutus sp.]|nr:hypothetical protein [Opitutus sp.]
MVVAVAAAVIFSRSNAALQKHYPVTVRPVVISGGPEAVGRGKHLAQSRGCIDCHGADLGGTKVVENGAMGLWSDPNLSPGAGSRTKTLRDDDWEQAIRHGVGPDPRTLSDAIGGARSSRGRRPRGRDRFSQVGAGGGPGPRADSTLTDCADARGHGENEARG